MYQVIFLREMHVTAKLNTTGTMANEIASVVKMKC
jgi:hypothetical protein